MSSKIVEQSRSGLLGIGKKMLANERSARCSYLAMMTGFRRRGCFGRAQYRANTGTALNDLHLVEIIIPNQPDQNGRKRNAGARPAQVPEVWQQQIRSPRPCDK